MKIQFIEVPLGLDLDGWESNYFTGRSLALPFGRKAIITASQNEVPNYFRNKGFYPVLGDNGQAFDISEQGLFLDASVLNRLNGKPTGQWDAGDMSTFSSGLVGQLPAHLTVTSFDEASNPNFEFSSLVDNVRDEQILRAMGVAYKGAGKNYGGNYSGHAYVSRVDDPEFLTCERLRPGILDPQTALNGLRSGGAFNHRNTKFWDNDVSSFVHPLINKYWGIASATGQANARFAEFACNSILAENALIAQGNAWAKVINFFWTTYTEFSGYSQEHVYPVPGGGHYSYYTFPTYALHNMWEMIVDSYMTNPYAYFWGELVRFGNNKSIINVDENRDYDNFPIGHFYNDGTNNNPTRAAAVRDWTGAGTKGYFVRKMAYDNIQGLGSRTYQDLANWTGNPTFSPGQLRTAGSTNAFSVTSKDAILNQFQNKHVYCRLSSNTNIARASGIIKSFSNSPISAELKIPGTTNLAYFDLLPYTSYFFCIDVNA